MAALPPLQTLTLEQLQGEGGGLDTRKLLNGLNQFMGATHGALNKGISLSENGRASVVALRVRIPDYPSAAIANGANASELGAGYLPSTVKLGPGGWVDCNFAKSFSALAGGDVIGTIPAGYRPALTVGPLPVTMATERATVEIEADGEIKCYDPTGIAYVGFQARWQVASSSTVAPPPFSDSEWPHKVRHGLERCTDAIVTACRVVGLDEAISTAASCWLDWRDKGDGQLLVRAIYGLQPGLSYNLRILCLNEG